MATFAASDGTTLAYRSIGAGDPLVCLPGGPMRDSAYLGDLGGLGACRTLVVLDLRGTGRSAVPADVSTYRCDPPFFYGRWDAAARAHQAAEPGQRNQDAARVFGAEGAFDPPATRAALAAHRGPVLLLAGEVDLGAPPGLVAQLAELAPGAELVVQPGAGHYPWLDDADRFTATVSTFLRFQPR